MEHSAVSSLDHNKGEPLARFQSELINSCFSLSQVVLFSVTAGVALIGVLSRYLRRRKPPRPTRRPRKYTGRRTRNSMRSPNDLMSIAGSKASARSGSPVGSTVAYSDRFSMASGSIGAGAQNQSAVGATGVVQLTAQQLGVMGMEALDTVINFWEDALAAHYSPGGVPASLTTAEDSEFCREIQNLLEMSYTLQEQSELLFLDQRSVLFREEHSIDEAEEDGVGAVGGGGGGDDDDDRRSRKSVSILSRAGSDPNFDSAESFASALDQVADLREFESFIETTYEEYPLFQSALKHHDEYTVPCRTIRSELVHCSSDTEYLAKLHCVRLAFQFLFKDPAVGQWICESGRQILTDLLCLSDKDTKEFLVGYEDMVNFLQDSANWPIIQMELEQRNVKAMTFYDICLDFIILDSFRDLDAPPASVTAVVQNRWLSNGFKETVRQAGRQKDRKRSVIRLNRVDILVVLATL